jgi:kynurenine formamidase
VTPPHDSSSARIDSPYGPNDEAGALNEITAEKRIIAARLVQRGRTYDLAHVLDEHSPAFPGRTFRQWMHERAPEGGLGSNHVHWVAERFEATTQMGTHIDGLNHLQINKRTYNGHDIDEITNGIGTTKLGIETLPQVVTRGLLVDVARVRGVDRLEAGDVITIDDVHDALGPVRLGVERGDAVLFHTGWGQLWDGDPARYPTGQPGPGVALGEWLAERRIALTGCDTWSYGPVPPEDPNYPFLVPQTLNVRHGIIVAENLRLSDLARDMEAEFLFVLSHSKLRGATGSWVAPLAIV